MTTSFPTLRAWADDEVVRSESELSIIERRRKINRALNSVPPVLLSAQDRAAYDVQHAATPDMPAAEIMRRLGLVRELASRSFFRDKLTKLINRRKLLRRDLDPENDEELATAIAAAAAEELAILVPGVSPLYAEHRRTDEAGRFTADTERQVRRHQRLDVIKEDLEQDKAEQEKADRLRALRHRLALLGCSYERALAEEEDAARDRRRRLAAIRRSAGC